MKVCEYCGWPLASESQLRLHIEIKHEDEMIVAKGVTQKGGVYVWTCNKCNGTGESAAGFCTWCYGLDTERIIEEMNKGAKGQRYYALLKAFLSVKGKEIVDFAKPLGGDNRGFAPAAVGLVSLKFGLNFKATAEWLEETSVLNSGWYWRVMLKHITLPDGKSRRVQVQDILEAARQKWPDFQ